MGIIHGLLSGMRTKEVGYDLVMQGVVAHSGPSTCTRSMIFYSWIAHHHIWSKGVIEHDLLDECAQHRENLKSAPREKNSARKHSSLVVNPLTIRRREDSIAPRSCIMSQKVAAPSAGSKQAAARNTFFSVQPDGHRPRNIVDAPSQCSCSGEPHMYTLSFDHEHSLFKVEVSPPGDTGS